MTTALSDLAFLYSERNRIKSSLCEVEMAQFRAMVRADKDELKGEQERLTAELAEVTAKIAAIEDEQQGNLFEEGNA
jgi:hypothetical protein